MSARAVAAVVLALAAGGCEAAAPARKAEPARSEPLRVSRLVPLTNAGFEAPPRSGERCAAGWACNMHADPESFAFRLDATRAAGYAEAFLDVDQGVGSYVRARLAAGEGR